MNSNLKSNLNSDLLFVLANYGGQMIIANPTMERMIGDMLETVGRRLEPMLTALQTWDRLYDAIPTPPEFPEYEAYEKAEAQLREFAKEWANAG